MHLVLLLYALFASVFTLSKAGLQYAQPLFFVGSRMAVAGCLLLTFLFFRGDRLKLKRSDLFKVLKLAIFQIYLTNILEFWGLQYLTSFKTCFIYSLSPFFSALFSYTMFSEKMSMKKWMGLCIGFIGLFPILMTETSSEEGLGHLFFISWAEISVIGAAIFSVYGWIVLRQLVSCSGLSPLIANGYAMLFGGMFALGHSALTESWDPIPVTDSAHFAQYALLLILISNLVCYNLYGVLLRKFTATFMSFAGFTTPLFTAFFGWFFLGEEVSHSFFLSIAVVFSGLLIFYIEEITKEKFVRAGDAS